MAVLVHTSMQVVGKATNCRNTSIGLYHVTSGAGSNLKVEGHKIFFYCAPPLFRGAPGHCRKVQGTVTRTERYLTFQGHAVSKVTSPTE